MRRICIQARRGRHHVADSCCTQLRAEEYSGPIVIDSEDTDVYVQAAFVSQRLPGDLLLKRKRTFDARTMLSTPMLQML